MRGSGCWMHLAIALAGVMISLGACATASSESGGLVCVPVPNYRQEFLDRVADEVERLPQSAARLLLAERRAVATRTPFGIYALTNSPQGCSWWSSAIIGKDAEMQVTRPKIVDLVGVMDAAPRCAHCHAPPVVTPDPNGFLLFHGCRVSGWAVRLRGTKEQVACEWRRHCEERGQQLFH